MEESIKEVRSENKEIDIKAIITEFWQERRLIFKITLFFTFLGLFIAVFSKNQYTSTTTFVPITQGKSMNSSLGGLASLAGINLGGSSSSSEVSPELYPEIVGSLPFQKELLNTPLSIKGQDSLVSYKFYYENIHSPGVLGYLKKYTIGLISELRSLLSSTDKQIIRPNNFGKNSIISVTKEDNILIKKLIDQINLNVNKKEGFVSISVTMPEALASSQLTIRAQELLQETILKLKTQKSLEQLKFTEARFFEKKKEFNEKKIELASFKDQNSSINTALANTRLLQLQSDYDLIFTVYSELAKQVETQRLQVKQDTPLFTVLKPVSIPIDRSSPRNFFILSLSTFFGLLFSIGFIRGRHYLSELKSFLMLAKKENLENKNEL